MNKFDALNIVTVSNLSAQNKAMLVELILRSDDKWYSWPSVQRLCMARGMAHEKNFKGADYYLPGIVTKQKRGRKMTYTLVPEEIQKLEEASVVIKHTPSRAGSYTPDEPDHTPGVADNTPDEQGANTTKNITIDTSLDNTDVNAAVAAQTVRETTTLPNTLSSAIPSNRTVGAEGEDSPDRSAPAIAGVSRATIEDSTKPGMAKFNRQATFDAYLTHMRHSRMTSEQENAVRALVLDREWNIDQVSPNHRVSDAIQAVLHG